MNLQAKAVGPSPVSDRATRLTRGHGQGNLAALLRYWRRQGKRPGLFRRCVRKLRDEPGIIQPPNRLCAWIVYQVHGHWPGSRAHRAGKSFESFMQKQTLRDMNSVYYQPLNGSQSLIDYKAAMFAKTHQPDDLLHSAWGLIANAGFNEGEDKSPGWFVAARKWRDQYHEYLGLGEDTKDLVPNTIQGAASTLLPGETRPWREAHPRRIGYSLLFGGGPGGRGGLGGRIGRGIGGGNGRNPYRCPAGFEGGGRFTNRSLSTCGVQILALPGGAIPAEARRAAQNAIRKTRNEGGSQPATNIEISEVHQAQLRKLRGAVPPDVSRPNAAKRSNAINHTMNQLNKATGRDGVLQRLVRQDGVVLTPLVGVNKLASQRNSDDLKGAAYLTKFNSANSRTGVDELGLLRAGVSEIHFALPGNVRVVASTGKKVSPRDALALQARAATLAKKNSFPMGGLVGLSGESNLFRLTASAPKVSEPNQKVRVKTESGISRVVPRWVYLTFLSKEAPLRSPKEPIYTLVEEIGGPSAKKANETYEKFEQKVLAFHARIQ